MVPRRNREPTMVHTWLSCSARAGIAVISRDPLRDYTDVISFVDILSGWSWHFVSICRDILSNLSFVSCQIPYHKFASILSLGITCFSTFKSLVRISGRDSFKGGRLWHPGCQFHIMSGDYPNLGCLVKISISRSHLSPFIKLLVNVSLRLELFNLKNSQIWSLLKLLFLGANTNSKVNLVSQLPSKLIYSDSR